MAIRTALLSSRNINLDTDFSKYIETVSEPGVIEGLELANSKIGVGKARVPCERTNGETIYALVQNFNEVSLDTSGNGYIIISISQNIIDDGSLGNEDGTGIATIQVVQSLPSKNYLELYSLSSGTATDERNMIKKVGELNTAIESMQGAIDDLDDRVEALEEAGAIDHLEEMALVGEKYTMNDTLFKQITPALGDSTVEANVGDVDANKEIHIQRLGSGTPSNELKLKIKQIGSPTTGLTVEVRKGIKVDVSETEAYWYGDSENILATGTITYSDITSDFSEIAVTLDNEVGGIEGELLDIVVYQTGSIVNSTNYYILGCDSTQWSEGFSYVKVNGTTRTRTKLMPYCISDGFVQAMLAKVSLSSIIVNRNITINVPNINAGSGENGVKQNIYLNENTRSLSFSFSGKFGMDAWSGGQTGTYGYYVGTTETQLGSGDTYTTMYDKTGSGTIAAGSVFGLYWRPNNYRYSVAFKTQGLTVIISGDFEVFKKVSTKDGKPLEAEQIGEKAKINLLGNTLDNTRFVDETFFTDSDKIKYCKTKGTSHSLNVSSYTAIGYGYVVYTGGSGSNIGEITINGNRVAYCNNTYMSGIQFFKPGDRIILSNLTSIKMYDFY